MFTGIVEELGEVAAINRGNQSIELVIQAKQVLEDVQLGDSIATNGVCLTVTEFSDSQFSVDVMPETLRNSSLKELEVGTQLNLERALRLQDRLGGHLVSGHIDGVGRIKQRQREDNAILVTISLPTELSRYLIPKGSIAVDGVSLTVARLENNSFTISLIPHTAQETTLGFKQVGELVNLEVDLIGKYVERMLKTGVEPDSKEAKTGIDSSLLAEQGFI
ncbi:riboflavin synthase [Fuchsiella alkaliacetigena]|uniref:riboflavin synthase n=1 Tax=Fuchsiella alkaliacetigena TaxID=957042 RepID=UPI00200B7222|nr:riboflavin synthase [Fuchsiella alkaliacetigena]MCK8823609.1 riboflavin synthase [Fuchsiella alkaliacetigena]